MGDSEWQKVTRKSRRSVFDRLKFSQNSKSNMDDLAKISLTVYVSNFPSHLTVRELWNICGKKGTIVDVFIAKHKNIRGQMFAFCRFIKVSNKEALIDALSNIWIGKLRMHANLARFDRKATTKTPHVGVNKPYVNLRPVEKPSKTTSYANAAKSSVGGINDPAIGANVADSVSKGCEVIPPSIILDHDICNDFPLALLGCYKDFRAIANARIMCRNEGFLDVGIKYLGGLWVLFEFQSLDAKLNFLKHEGVLSWFSSLKPWHDDFVVSECLIWLEIEGVPLRAWHNDTFMEGVSYATRVRELCSWTPTFVGDEDLSEGEDYLDMHDDKKEDIPDNNDVESVVGDDMENVFEQIHEVQSPKNVVHNQAIGEESHVCGDSNKNPTDSDPFGLNPLIMKAGGKDVKSSTSKTPSFPPGFSPMENDFVQNVQVNVCNEAGSDSIHNHSNDNSKKHFGFSMVDRLEETIKVGSALGFNMKGCESTLASLIAENGDFNETKTSHVDLWALRQVWGNSNFGFASASAREGLWIPKNVRIMWVVVYAPQSLSCKIALWSSLASFISNWNGISVVMGDFNEVRFASERFGSIFNERQAEIFNSFIDNSSLLDIPLGGFNFTWTNKWGSKMSKLDRFLVSDCFLDVFPNATGVVLEKGRPDHRPIFLKESMVDYGPTPFRFFHSWLGMDGFHNLVTETWNNDGIVEHNGLISFKKKLQNLKHVIRDWIASKRLESHKLKIEHQARLSAIDVNIDNCCATDEDFSNRRESMKILGDIDRREASDFAQKSKIKWALEGDENSNFFHGSLKRFNIPKGFPTSLNVDMPNPISLAQREFLEHHCSREEIKKAVWDCGGDRAPGPDGFTFKFITSFWDLLEADVVRFVDEFFHSG
ncbi:putative RNA-directed DNA polymerase, eukaryota, reverse transcriptase zinc-binding domain protein, partial [Tanacetum coccineum]